LLWGKSNRALYGKRMMNRAEDGVCFLLLTSFATEVRARESRVELRASCATTQPAVHIWPWCDALNCQPAQCRDLGRVPPTLNSWGVCVRPASNCFWLAFDPILFLRVLGPDIAELCSVSCIEWYLTLLRKGGRGGCPLMFSELATRYHVKKLRHPVVQSGGQPGRQHGSCSSDSDASTQVPVKQSSAASWAGHLPPIEGSLFLGCPVWEVYDRHAQLRLRCI